MPRKTRWSRRRRSWRAAGVQDSKKIAESQIIKLDKLIRETRGVAVCTCLCGMPKYNELMSRPHANLNRLLHATEYTTIALDLRDPIAIRIEGVCRTPDAGRQLEQSLRAILSLTAAASARQPALAAMLHAIQIHRDESTVHVTLSTGTDALSQLQRAF